MDACADRRSLLIVPAARGRATARRVSEAFAAVKARIDAIAGRRDVHAVLAAIDSALS
jgi:hypothetical protein